MGGKLAAALDVRPLQVGHARGHDFGEKGGKPNCAQAWEMVLVEGKTNGLDNGPGSCKKMGLIGVQMRESLDLRRQSYLGFIKTKVGPKMGLKSGRKRPNKKKEV